MHQTGFRPLLSPRASCLALVLCLSFVACRRPVLAGAPAGEPDILTAGFEARARTIAAAMSDEELVGQAMIIGVEGVGRLSNASRSILERVQPGAVILFGFNVGQDPRTVASLAADIRMATSAADGTGPAANDGGSGEVRLPPFVAIDHEGGTVYRFKGGLTRLPAARTIGRAGDVAARAAGEAAGTELLAVGVTMNAAPVVESLTEGNHAFLLDRVWSDDPGSSGSLSAAFIEACQSNGTAAVAKHFPGNAAVDPHRGLPVLDATASELETSYFIPFRAAIHAGVSTVMLSHVLAPALDPSAPVSVSRAAIAALKSHLGFRGIVMTDDLQMAALSGLGGPEAAAVAALSAGADMLMVSGGRTALSVRAALVAALAKGTLSRARLEDAASRVIAQKLRFGLDAETASQRTARLASLDATVARNRVAMSDLLSGNN